jgi:hypothetical protein
VNLEKLSGDRVRAWWLDPRSGTALAGETFPRAGTREFRPRSRGKGQDWVLVLDDASRGYPAPGIRPE